MTATPGESGRRVVVRRETRALGSTADRFVAGRVARGELTTGSGRVIRIHLRDFASSYGDRPVSRLGRADVDRWLSEISHLSIETRRAKVYALRGFCAWLVDQGVIRRDPTRGVPVPRQHRSVPIVHEQEDVVRLYHVGCPDARARLIVILMAQLGLRCKEVVGLDLADIGSKWVTVREGKGGHQRSEPLQPEVVEALRAYIAEERGSRPGPLIQSKLRPGLPLRSKSLSQMVAEWSYAAGVKTRPFDGKGAHCLRRTFATDVLENEDADIVDVADSLGHSDLKSVLRYTKRKPKRLERALRGRVYTRVVDEVREIGAVG